MQYSRMLVLVSLSKLEGCGFEMIYIYLACVRQSYLPYELGKLIGYSLSDGVILEKLKHYGFEQYCIAYIDRSG